MEFADKDLARFDAKVQKTPTCWLWTACALPKGYGKFGLHGKTVTAHRFQFFRHNGYLPPVVRHTCDVPACVNPHHLLGGTQKENMQDQIARGRKIRTHTVLTEPLVLWLVTQFPTRTDAELSAELGVSLTVVNHVRRGYSWGSLTGIKYNPTRKVA